MIEHTSMLHVGVDDDVKEQAPKALAAMELSMSDVVRLFFRRVAIDQAFSSLGMVRETGRGLKGGGPEPEDGQ